MPKRKNIVVKPPKTADDWTTHPVRVKCGRWWPVKDYCREQNIKLQDFVIDTLEEKIGTGGRTAYVVIERGDFEDIVNIVPDEASVLTLFKAFHVRMSAEGKDVLIGDDFIAAKNPITTTEIRFYSRKLVPFKGGDAK